MRFIKVFFCLALSVLSVSLSSAQNTGASPYSRLGIGDQVDPAFSRNAGLGGAGVALSHNLQLNFINPASLAAIKYTNFEFGLIARKQTLSTSNDSYYGTGGNIHHMSLALPIHRKYNIQFGARPFSVVNYKDEYDDNAVIPTRLYNISLSGSGGLSEFFFGNAYNYKDWLMIGCQAGYIVGATNIQRSITDVGNNQSVFQRKTSESHLRISPGILITKRFIKPLSIGPLDSLIKDSSTRVLPMLRNQLNQVNENWNMGFGLTASFFHTINAEQSLYYRKLNYVPGAGYILYSVDTLANGKVSNYSIPFSARAGLSLYKTNHITYALDYYYSNWSSFSETELAVVYRAQHMLAAGAEYIPDYNNIKLYKRIAYRLGAKVNSLPYEVVGQSIAQWQVNGGVGLTLPKSGVTINMSLAYGQQGTTSANLVKENYWLFTFGVIANSRWFVRPKHD